ncbi:MAG: hypothetical protein ACKODT_05215, partial [Fluviibacter sp.]
LGSLGNATIRCPLWQTGRYCTALAAVAHLWSVFSALKDFEYFTTKQRCTLNYDSFELEHF